jgi:hypothetical protein
MHDPAWPSEDPALKRRGPLMLWLDPEMEREAVPSGKFGWRQ